MSTWEKGHIHGVIIKKLVRHIDQRGCLTETFRIDDFSGNIKPLMSYVSFTEPGVSRGPHEHRKQTDIFSFIGPGSFLIRVWDNRKDSETYGKFMEFFCGQDNPVTVLVPPGVVHGYKNISRVERGMVINYPDRLFMGWNRKKPVDEIRYEGESDSQFKMED